MTDRDGPAAVLVGFMGAGKSTVGSALADLLGVHFVDSDHEIVRRSGRRIEQIFADDGEEHFRHLEAEVVRDLLATHRGVLALGGGAVLTPAVRAALHGHPVVHLDVTPDAGFARVRTSRRPLLQSTADRSPEQRYGALHSDRAPTYRDVATVTVDTSDLDPATVARTIVDLLVATAGQAPIATDRVEDEQTREVQP